MYLSLQVGFQKSLRESETEVAFVSVQTTLKALDYYDAICDTAGSSANVNSSYNQSITNYEYVCSFHCLKRNERWRVRLEQQFSLILMKR